MLTNIISISLGAILINNFIFSQFLGCCPFLGCSSKVETATGMGLAVVSRGHRPALRGVRVGQLR